MNLIKLERKLIPNLRHKKSYKMAKFVLFLPFILLLHGIKVALVHLLKKIRFKRKGKPDIVLENIVAGWKNLVLHNAVTEQVALVRANICAECPSAVFSGGIHTIVVDRKTTQIRGLKCNECGCPLSAKVRSSNDYCPLGKW